MSDTAKVDAVVAVDVNDVLEARFLGAGVQVSSYPEYEIGEENWQRVFERMEYLSLPLTRVMLSSGWYCEGLVLSLPAKSALYVTTIEEGQPLMLR